MTDRRQVTIKSTRPALTVVAWMGKDPPTMTDGYGGWTVRNRPRRQGLTVYAGHEPYTMELPLLFDGFRENDPVDAELSALERMARPPADYQEPPLVRVTGPIPHADLQWVINGIRWGTSVRNEGGYRVRQEVTLTLLRYIAEDRVNVKGSAERARSKTSGSTSSGGGSVKLYTVKSGDTLSGIAAKLLGNYKRWTEIASLNGIRDPKLIVPGQPLRIPAK